MIYISSKKQLEVERAQLNAVFSLVSIQLVDLEVLHSQSIKQVLL